MRRSGLALPLLLVLSASASGCGGDESGAAATTSGRTTSAATTSTEPPFERLDEPKCDPEAANCAEARGEIAYVERVDPDGDGDAHFVLVSAAGITGPGITVVDVRADLRPRPLPRPGDLLAAAGPVYSGSYGQDQIQAEAIDFVRVAGG